MCAPLTLSCLCAYSRTARSGADSAGGPPIRSAPGARTERGGREGAAGRDEEAAEASFWESAIVPLLAELGATDTGRDEGSVERLCDVCVSLHGVLTERQLLGRCCHRRAEVLRTLFRLIDLDSALLNLHIAKLCLALCVSGKNLLNICKLIFKISRSESNDELFQNNSIIDSLLVVLGSEDVCASGEAVLYCVGTLKFLSGNGALLRLLLAKGCVGVVHQLLQRLHPLSEPGHAYFTTAGHILVQLTATLRNLADHPESRQLSLSHDLLSELSLTLRHHQDNLDVCTNTARVFSKLSSYSECCLALAQTPDCYQIFIELLRKHHQKQDLAVRLLFTLGNLTAKSDEARQRLFRVDGCTGALLQVYRAYQRRDAGPPSPTGAGPPPGRARESEDVLVKLVRVLANMCIHPDVGPALAADPACVELLMETLERRSVAESEELLVNVGATVNNLSFYWEQDSALRNNQLAIAKLILRLLLSSSMDAMLEGTRVYGNLSQSRDVRDFIMQNKVDQFVVTLLDSKSCEVCYAACGVLTNLALDTPKRAKLSREGAAAKLSDCLRDFGPGDWQLAGQACRTLWNLTEPGDSGSAGLHVALSEQEREALLEILELYSCEEEALCMTDHRRACWESEFLPVAQKLIQRLQPASCPVNPVTSDLFV